MLQPDRTNYRSRFDFQDETGNYLASFRLCIPTRVKYVISRFRCLDIRDRRHCDLDPEQNIHEYVGQFGPVIFPFGECEQEYAICCDYYSGPIFGQFDLHVRDHCDVRESCTNFFGQSSVNSTGVDGLLCLTGSRRFLVKEIEVSKVMDETFT
jgi:hypothetical protein